MRPPVALTIAGSDSSGGAGVQADLRTFAAHRVHGASAFAALTAQNTTGVISIEVISPEFLVTQVEAVLADVTVAAVKTGMLASADNVAAVAGLAEEGRLPNLVVDPVMVASSGARLLDVEAEATYRYHLIPFSQVVTPNRAEAAALLGHELRSAEDVRTAAQALVALGPEMAVITGAGADGAANAVDVVATSTGEVHELTSSRVATGNDHGSGCSFASAIAARLAHSDDPLTAIEAAKAFVHSGLTGAAAWHLGAGPGPIDHLGWGTDPGPPPPDRPTPTREDP